MKKSLLAAVLSLCPLAATTLAGCTSEVREPADEGPLSTLQSALTAYSNSFETSTNFPTGWTTWHNCAGNTGWSATRYNTASDNPAPGGGSYALRFHTTTFTASCSFPGLYSMSPAFSVTAGTVYQVGAWIRNGGGAGATNISFYNASGVQVGQAETPWLSDAWQYNQETTLAAVAPTGATTARVRFALNSPSTYADVDLLKVLTPDGNTVTTLDGLWTASSYTPTRSGDDLRASALFTGPTGATKAMGVCLLKEYGGLQACTAAADCANLVPPTGGFNYCTAPYGAGTQKYCYYRPGAASDYCAGSPALPGFPKPAVAPGLYQTPLQTVAEGTYISYACFGGCTGSIDNEPAISSARIVQTRTGTFCIKFPDQCL